MNIVHVHVCMRMCVHVSVHVLRVCYECVLVCCGCVYMCMCVVDVCVLDAYFS